MLDTVLGALGILVSVVFFVVGYRQTVGAKKERIAACNAEVERILLRRIVLEAYMPTRLDLGRLLDGKARDFRVRADDLRSVAQVMNSLYTRIVESDVIPAPERKSILDRIAVPLSESESQSEAEVEATSQSSAWLNRTAPAVGLMAGMAATVGALITAVPEFLEREPFTTELLRAPLSVAAVSIAFISILLAVFRIRSSQEETPTRAEEARKYVRLEGHVVSTLKRAGFTVVPRPPGSAGDFYAERNGQKLLVEVKSWPRRVPSQVIAALGERLKQAANEIGAADVIIVTAVPLLQVAEDFGLPGIRIVSGRDFAAYVRKTKGAA